MLVLVINAGSSSLKSQLIQTDTDSCLMKALAERIGSDDAELTMQFAPDMAKERASLGKIAIEQALSTVLDRLVNDPRSPIGGLGEIEAIGNRIVSGGEYFSHSVVVDEDVLRKVELCSELAPLHNPAAAACIRHMMGALPSVRQVVVFDSAFHMTMPPAAYMYPIPMRYYREDHVRRYGAHGTSHRYASAHAAEMLGRDIGDLGIITCHLGNGGSISAVDGGRCIDTSMGLTPLEGIMMGTRSGSIDPAIVVYLMRHGNLSCDEVDDILNKKSGLLGVSGVSPDMREVRAAAHSGNEDAQLALDMYAYRIKKFIGAYFAVLPHTDAVVLTAGVGENSAELREMIFDGLEHLGMILDKERNADGHGEKVISADGSPVKILVVCTDEEMLIAHETEGVCR